MMPSILNSNVAKESPTGVLPTLVHQLYDQVCALDSLSQRLENALSKFNKEELVEISTVSEKRPANYSEGILLNFDTKLMNLASLNERLRRSVETLEKLV